MTKQIGAGLQACAEKIWTSADTLRGAGIKGSDYPKLMMPFFALMLLESRLLRQRKEMIDQFELSYGLPFDHDPQEADVQNDLLPALAGAGLGYHQEIAESGLGLAHLAQVQGGNFLNKMKLWIDRWDADTKRLLGVGYAQGQLKFLDMDGMASDLQAKGILWAFARKWGEIDLVPFSNSEVTTVEEHIKRKWADISADTAGEQYTPSDVIDLAVDINAASIARNLPKDGIVRVYDPTCGGGNFVFAAEDILREKFPAMSTVSRGQEFNDSLYALAAIEARFRPNSKFEYGNTLTNDGFQGDEFDVVVANPPYGVDWKDVEKQVKSDASGRFAANRMPPTSDGQLLFLQHIVSHLSAAGVASVIHSGSTLFSGDAGGGESETRKWLLKDRDVVEAIIQLPKNEFFNTGIATYMWILNAAKPAERKGKVLMIDASSCSVKLKKNLNMKNCEIDEANRAIIVDAFLAFKNGPISRVMEVDELLYNKVEISITRKNEEGVGVSAPKKVSLAGCKVIADGAAFDFDKDGVLIGQTSPKEALELIKAAIKDAADLEICEGEKVSVSWNSESGEVFENGVSLGKGALSIKGKISKAKGVETLKVEAELSPMVEKDNETIPFSSELKKNQEGIAAFLKQWVKEPCEVVGAKVGCEINFNRLFPKKTVLRTTEAILAELAEVDVEINKINLELNSGFKGA